MSASEPSLIDRIRDYLADQPSTREVRMFGGLSFMVNNSIVVAARPGDALLVRADPDRSAELLGRPGAREAEMGNGRGMGPSWLHVDSEALESDEDLTFWLEVAMDFNRRSRT